MTNAVRRSIPRKERIEGHVADVSKEPGICVECKTGYNAEVWVSGDYKKEGLSHYRCDIPWYGPKHVAVKVYK